MYAIRSYYVIVRRVVTVVARRLENRVEIDRGHAQRREVIQLFADAVAVPAEKVVGLILIRTGRRRIANVLAPAVVDAQKPAEIRVILRAFTKIFPAAPAEPVGKNLVDDSFAPVFGRCKPAVIYGDLIGVITSYSIHYTKLYDQMLISAGKKARLCAWYWQAKVIRTTQKKAR